MADPSSKASSQDAQYPTVNLAVDVGFGGTEEMSADQKAYMEKVSKSVAELREAGIPTIWISMSSISKLHAATEAWPSPAPEARDAAELRGGDFLDHGVVTPVSADNAAFIQAFGPKKDEVLFQKAFFDAFTRPQDVDKLEKHLEGQRPAKYAIDVWQAFDGPSLQDHLKALGVKQVTLMGGNSDVCVMSTAMGAAMEGYKAVILTDLVISNDDPFGKKPPAFHEDKIKEKLAKITDRPDQLKGNLTHSAYADASLLSDAERNKIRNGVEYAPLDQFLPSPSAPASSLGQVMTNRIPRTSANP